MSAARWGSFRVGLTVAAAVVLALPSPIAGGAGAASRVASPPGPAEAPNATSWIVTFQPTRGRAPDPRALAEAAGGKAGQTFEHALHGFVFKGSAEAAAALQRNPAVRTVVADGSFRIQADTKPTGVRRIRANHDSEPSAYGEGFTGAGVKVAILDTGIDLTHPDLVPNLNVGLGRNCMTGGGQPQDGHGHGTHVAGTVAAAANGQGVIGVAPDATLVPFKVLDDTGYGEWSNLICAIDILTGYAKDADPSNDIRIANMSLGDTGGIGNCNDGAVRQAICTSVAAGITYVAAAGNSTVDVSGFIPAAFPEVIAVSAITDLDGEPGGAAACWLWIWYCDDTLAEFSNYGSGIDIAAPGTQILSDWTGGGTAEQMGTSMASPHVTGVGALILGAFPSSTPADIRARLRASGTCPNGEPADSDGGCAGQGQWGNDPDGIAEPLVNALNAVSGGALGDRRPSVQITAPANGGSVSGTVSVTASATDDVGVVKVEFFVNGALAATDTDGSNGWSMSWNTTALDGGRYTITAKATDTANQTASAFVTVQAGTNAQGSWVGKYGNDGYVLGNWFGSNTDYVNLPGSITYTLEAGARGTWATTTTEVRALQSPDATERRAQTFYADTDLRLRLSFANAYTGTLHLYALDWDAWQGNRYETVTVDDGHGPRTVQLTTAFIDGAWVHVPLNVAAGGSATVSIHKTAGNTAVLGGFFLGGPGAPPPPPLPVDNPGAQGNWVGTYGASGYILANWWGNGTDLASVPAGMTYGIVQGGRATWASTTTEVRALQNPTKTERRSQTFYDTGDLRLQLSFSQAWSGTLHLYAVDWDAFAGYRLQTITVNDGRGPQTAQLSTPFTQGAWVHVPIVVAAGGGVSIAIHKTGGYSAVLAGLFFDAAAPPPPPPPTAPGAPTGLGATAGNGQVTLSWSAPSSDGGSPITGYTVTASPGGATCGDTTLSCTISGLTNGTQYSFTVTARNAVGTSQPSASVSATPATVPGAPTGLAGSPGNGQVALTWTAPSSNGGASITSYTVTASPGGRTCSAPGLSCTVTGLTNGTPYSFTVTATNAMGTSNPSAPATVTPATVPGAPTGLIASAGDGQVTLTWTAPSSNGGAAITQYTVTASPGTQSCSGPGTSCTVLGLTNGTLYSFTVTATNAMGTSTPSAAATATPVGAPTAPGAPTGLTAAPGKPGGVKLTWTAPTSNGGSPITGYRIYRSTSSGTEQALPIPLVAGTTYTDVSTQSGVRYYYRVAAVNAINEGPLSNEVNARAK